MTSGNVIVILCLIGIFVPSESSKTADFVENVGGVKFVMKAIPSGEFLMGCGEHEEPCSTTEWIDHAGGIRQVRVSVNTFYMAATETTWDLYQQCIDSGACPGNDSDGGDNGWGKGRRPVIEVSWNDVTNYFLPWLNLQTGRSYRLPTEVEWEYAARAGSETRFAWGDEIDCSKAQYGFVSKDCGVQNWTVEVGSFEPNAFGLYDVHGNVWEYVQDCWREDSGPATRLEAEPLDATQCSESILRGGSWLNAPRNLRSATRFRHERHFRESGDGFRLAHD